MKNLLSASIFVFLCAVACEALQVQVYPGDPVYVNLANPNRGYTDLVLHNIAIVNDSDGAVQVDKAVVEILEGNAVVESRLIGADEIQKSAAEIAGMKQQGMDFLVDLDFPWKKTLGEKIGAANGSKLGPQQAALIQKIFVTVQGLPTAVEVHAYGTDAKGKTLHASTRLNVSRGQSSNKYHFPLQGVWLMRSIPNVTSHHRWHSDTEFAVDFWKLGENSLPWKTDRSTPEDFYAFGAAVLAAADGVVVDARNDAAQDYTVYARKKGESEPEYGNRLEKHNMEMMKSDLRGLLGNFVVIQHAGGEYSSYAHLKTGSVKVKTGDPVTTGQQIAEVGDTGDTNLVHLHFQVSDGPDPLTSRSIPFQIVDLAQTDPDLGRIVRLQAP